MSNLRRFFQLQQPLQPVSWHSLAGFSMVLALTIGILAVSPCCVKVFGEDLDEEEAGPTPVNEFAPEDVRPSRTKVYDQGLTISRISIEGNRLINENQITETMGMKPGSLYSRKRLQQDLRRIYDMGYFTDNIKAVPVSTRDGIVVRIEVQENAPVTGVNINGNTIVSNEELQSVFANQTGLPQNISQLNESIEKIESIYAAKGYVLARVTSITDDPDGTINLEINEGVVDNIQFVGNRKTKDFVLERMLATRSGEVYNEKLLAEDLKRIFSTQSFSDVRRVITVSPDDPDRYNLTIEVDEKRTGAISIGGGVDTGTGAFGSVGYADPNFLGRGQNFSSVASVGTGVIGRSDIQANARTYQFEVGWSDPAFMQTDNAVGVNLSGRDLASFNVPLAIERRIGGDVTWARPIYSLNNTSMSLALGGENVSLREGATRNDLERYNVPDDVRDKQLEGGTFINLTPTIAYDTRDNRFDPTSGWLASASVTGAYGLSGDSYGTASANIRKYLKIRDGLTLALNLQGGTQAFGDIPEFNMFRMGGAWSVRGFQEGGLGSGGGFLMSSAELRSGIPFINRFENLKKLEFLRDNVKLAAFLDAGTLFSESDSNQYFDRGGYAISTGVGVRLNIPGVGPLRVDYAIPLVSGNDNFTRRFNFGVGQKF